MTAPIIPVYAKSQAVLFLDAFMLYSNALLSCINLYRSHSTIFYLEIPDGCAHNLRQ